MMNEIKIIQMMNEIKWVHRDRKRLLVEMFIDVLVSPYDGGWNGAVRWSGDGVYYTDAITSSDEVKNIQIHYAPMIVLEAIAAAVISDDISAAEKFASLCDFDLEQLCGYEYFDDARDAWLARLDSEHPLPTDEG